MFVHAIEPNKPQGRAEASLHFVAQTFGPHILRLSATHCNPFCNFFRTMWPAEYVPMIAVFPSVVYPGSPRSHCFFASSPFARAVA